MKPRLLVALMSMPAEAPFQAVDRLPRALFEEYDCEVLSFDDASRKCSVEVADDYRAQHRGLRLTILRNEYYQGHGGTQKMSFAYAIAGKFDFVAVLPGDGRHPLEDLPRLLEPLKAGEADAVLGTRLSHSRSGHCAYAVAALAAIPYRLNSDGRVFDTEILLQLLNAKRRIIELPVAALARDAMGWSDYLRDARDVLLATLGNGFHRAGILYQRRFDPQWREAARYPLKLGYASSHSWALEAVPAGETVIDLGAGTGGLAQKLLEKNCKVCVVDRHPPEEAGQAEVVAQDLDEPLRFDVRAYRYVLLLDIIEHLRDPELFLERLRAQFDQRPRTIILTTPNVAFFVQRIMLLLGQFNYGKAGILDRTHTRLFTFRGTRHLLRDAGFRIKRIRGVPAPFPKVWSGAWGRAALAINLALIKISKTLFAYQIFVEAESTPDIDFLLQEAKATASSPSASPGKSSPP